jgi:integrase
MRAINKLSSTQVKAQAGKAKLLDGAGLYLIPQRNGAASWILRFTLHGRSREMGLGGYPQVSLAQARALAIDARTLVSQKIDPIEKRKRDSITEPTFGELADQYLERRKTKGTHPKTDWQWERDLTQCASKIRKMPISAISVTDIVRILQPIWVSKWETADRLRRRLASVFDMAISEELIRSNPATVNILTSRLPHRPEKRSIRHHPSLDFRHIAEFMAELNKQPDQTARAMELLILSGLRSLELRGAKWEEFDIEDRVWNVPASRMKTRVAHRVPLCQRTLDLLETLNEVRVNDFVFPSYGKDGFITDGSLHALLKRMGKNDASPHGFRATFRTWASERTNIAQDILEACIAHKASDVYQRGDMLNRRREVMNRWADFCHSSPAKVIPLHAG